MDEMLRTRVPAAVTAGVENLVRRQSDDGSWHFAYTGPTFLLPMYVTMCHVSGTPIPAERAARMRAHLVSTIGDDGSVGMYAGGPGWVFTSTLGYVALRLLGEDADAEHMARLRAWIRGHGTPLRSASWGKILLCPLGLYSYEGLHPLATEAMLLPRWAPLHPRRLWMYARQVYMPMAWLYGQRAVMPEDELVRALRAELYDEPYDRIDWSGHRSTIAPCDNHQPLTRAFRCVSTVLRGWERIVPRRLRSRALRRLAQHIDYECEITDGVVNGSVCACLYSLVHHFREPGGERFRTGLAALEDYLRNPGPTLDLRPNNSTQQWDTALVVQALGEAQRAVEGTGARTAMQAGLDFVDRQQIRDDPPDRIRFHRDRSRGGWPFTTRAYGWVISDCTAEALSAIFRGEALALDTPERTRLEDAVELLLAYQNPDGGWPMCERIRGGRWLERLNPSQIFGVIMVDCSHVEITASCLHALTEAQAHVPPPAAAGSIDRAVAAGREFLLRSQRTDGSFEGFWGVCFTYGTWFGLRGLLAAGVSRTDPAVRRAVAFLLSIQRADGSWGESPRSCVERRYVPADEGKAVMTAWALLALVEAGYARHPACVRGVRFLVDRQRPDGGFAREGFHGAFNRTGPLDYDGYRHYFPVWALAMWCNSASGHEVREADVEGERNGGLEASSVDAGGHV
ncbi:prenyltransferase/squalene oxidase repeat-containing protein [Streptomyces niveiscabiei]|uniref:prenyltransferase/squalene oxidase repeat-containing protein n=1 Tax=Streptomyces niveiscabiei TaxID=164115 RepID=UPI0029A901FA|nr:prenyltransferase/squalene oxidase repeat-containing protein [Streptomyces niveiscabiei]MDX3387454.1 prenyltransferase/squalene oxidase repeat-containing protein [Streptomyces niveiscabiei]